MTVWASTQSPFGLRDGIMRELGIPAEKVRVITPFVVEDLEVKENSSRGLRQQNLPN